MKTYGGVDVETHIFLTCSLVEGECSASRSGRFTSAERTSGTHWIGGWVNPRASLDDLEKRIFLTQSGLELRSPSRPPVASRYTVYAGRSRVLVPMRWIFFN
jgi:hypothetical protein